VKLVIYLPVTALEDEPNVEQANYIFTLHKGNNTPVKSLPSCSRILQKFARNMKAEWEAVGRMLGIDEARVYAIQRDYAHSVCEQAYQMFHLWMTKNGSKATVGALTTALYDAGSLYWNLLDILMLEI